MCFPYTTIVLLYHEICHISFDGQNGHLKTYLKEVHEIIKNNKTNIVKKIKK